MKTRKLLENTVIDESYGAHVGKVIDVSLDGEQQVNGIVVKTRSGDKRFLPVNSFKIGKDSILISGMDCLKVMDGGDDHGIYQSRLGNLVLEESGREIGVLSDIVLRTGSNLIEGIEISGGIIKDLIDGRTEVPIDQVRSFEDQRLVITDQGGND
ncbi:MAG: PRC-barrel domain-containing protein [Acidobacteriota bacterium]